MKILVNATLELRTQKEIRNLLLERFSAKITICFAAISIIAALAAVLFENLSITLESDLYYYFMVPCIILGFATVVSYDFKTHNLAVAAVMLFSFFFTLFSTLFIGYAVLLITLPTMAIFGVLSIINKFTKTSTLTSATVLFAGCFAVFFILDRITQVEIFSLACGIQQFLFVTMVLLFSSHIAAKENKLNEKEIDHIGLYMSVLHMITFTPAVTMALIYYFLL